ncbi:MAG: peptide chain release factor 1 [Candidatus Nomurabacteria bacterium]|nr:MAG: peptide chain release factor 1 [Candidatus Nomurabacteria bacterium]HRV75938.1 peptide chain release factor 1 [Candidatus Saccharimonadales bacterium]
MTEAQILKYKSYREELENLKTELSSPDAFNDPKISQKNRRLSELEEIVTCFSDIEETEKQIQEAEEIIQSKDSELSEMARQEKLDLEEKLTNLSNQLRLLLVPKDPNDSKNAIIEVRAGAGGDEASLFASELVRMYLRWCENNNLKAELISSTPSESGGIKDSSIEVKGVDAYGKLKFEAGVHRVQRIPVTESAGRIHTSTATVAIMPEAEETDIEIKQSDLRIDVFRSSGNGGQSVNTTDSAVRITYLPTGLVVTCQDEKSQIKNKDKAMKVLRSRLLQIKLDQEQSELSSKRRELIGSGDRSEKIRTYNFPQDRVTDHRIGYSRSNIQGFMDGDVDDLFTKLKEAEVELIENE